MLSKDYWGKGLMPEAVECVIHWAFEEQKWDFLLCGHFLENDRSRRVVEKSGFRFYKDISYETQTGETKVSSGAGGYLRGIIMPNGIVIMGLNGCGKSTVCRRLAKELNYKQMDVEDYYFPEQENQKIPYAVSRTGAEVEALMLQDIRACGNYVLASVRCNWGEEFLETIKFAVVLSAPAEVRAERIIHREIVRFGDRVLEGGDMYESQQRFHAFAAGRSEDMVWESAKKLTCPILEIDATLSVEEIVKMICEKYSESLQTKDQV